MIVLDTHAAVWMTTDKRQLSAAAGDEIRTASRAGEPVAIASSTLWEIAMMSAKGRMRLPSALSEYLRYLEKTFVVLPITGAIAEQSMRFENLPPDPTDRIISATAVVHAAKLVTGDKKILKSGEVNCVW